MGNLDAQNLLLHLAIASACLQAMYIYMLR